MRSRANAESTRQRLLKEPLLHFVLLGGLLFALYSAVADREPQPTNEIVVSAARVDALVAEHESVWQRPPTAKELQGLIDNWVRGEVLYREGLAANLDRDDTVVRRRVVQKMTFLAESMAAEVPTDADVQQWFREHADDYRLEPTYSFRQVYFDPKRHPDDLDVVVEQARSVLKADGTAQVGDPTLLSASLREATVGDVSRVFGERFAAELPKLKDGEWAGPVVSGYGVHLVRIDARSAGRTPKLAEVRKAVERDLARASTEQAVEVFYRAARERYTVRVEAGPSRGGAPIAASVTTDEDGT